MSIYKVKDVRDLYPHLQEIARLNADDGDDSPGEVPYHISPSDIDAYYRSPGPGDSISAIMIDGRPLTAFEIVELYRQLAYFDKHDDEEGRLDGRIDASVDEGQVTIPQYAMGHHNWGPEWTIGMRPGFFLSLYPEMYLSEVNELEKKQPDKRFENAESYTEGNADREAKQTRPLGSAENEKILEFIDEIRDAGHETYAKLIEDSVKYMRVREILLPAEKREQAYMEAKHFGYTQLFDLGNESVISLIAYPQFGQKYNFFGERRCTWMTTAAGEKITRCMPLVGLNNRNDALDSFVGLYCKGEDVRERKGAALDYKWARMSHYMRRARVYNYLRYDIPELRDDKKLQAFFQKAVILHESIHYRNAQPASFFESFISGHFGIGGILDFFHKIGDPYHRNHVMGYYYVQLQRASLERSIIVRRDINKLKRLHNSGNDGECQCAKCKDLRSRLHFLTQLEILAEDAEERLIEDEIYSIFFKPSQLSEACAGSPKDLALNRNEVEELIPREERKRTSPDLNRKK